MAEHYHDIITFKSKLVRSIYKDEYFLADNSINSFFQFLKLNRGETRDNLIDKYHKFSEAQKGKRIAFNKLRRAFNDNLTTLYENEIIKFKGDKVEFDLGYQIIIKALENEPLTQSLIQEDFSSKIYKLNLIPKLSFIEYMEKLQTGNYIKKTSDLINDSNYHRLLEILSVNPLNLKEIELKYNKGLSEKNKKSENTVYRYVKQLEAANLLTLAGQRVTIGKTASEGLYTRTAIIYLQNEYDSAIWKGSYGQKISNLIKEIFNEAQKNKKLSIQEIQNILYQLSYQMEKNSINLIKDSQNLINDLSSSDISKYNFNDINTAFHKAGLIQILLENHDFINEFLENIK